MEKILLTKEKEEKRQRDFLKIAENWDVFPEYAQGKLDGMISMMASVCDVLETDKKAG